MAISLQSDPALQRGYIKIGGNTAVTITQSELTIPGTVACNTLQTSNNVVVSNNVTTNSINTNVITFPNSSTMTLAPKKTLGLNFRSWVTPTATTWSSIYTGSGGTIEVYAFITGYASGTAGLREYYLRKDGNTVVTGKFFFNQTGVHTHLPPLIYIDNVKDSGVPHTYSIEVNNISLDGNDFCTMLFTEF